MRRSQNFARTQKGEKRLVKYFPINQFIKGFSPGMAVNSYLDDNLQGKQFYFSFDFFFQLNEV